MKGLILSWWQPFCFALVLRLAFQSCTALNPDSNTKNSTYQNATEYDFIVIGAGSAGSVVANRLSEERNWHVLLLEAGGPETEFTDIPRYSGELVDTDIDWQYFSESPVGDQRYCLAMVNHSCKYPRGKALGGTSVINGMTYIRGNKLDYDHWAAMGNKGWGYEDVLKYFKKSEDNSNPELLKTRFHSSGGYLSVHDLRKIPLASIFIKGGQHLGYEHRLDVNQENHTGFATAQGTIRNGSRCSTAKAFITPAQGRKNLHISPHSFVTKIHFEQDGSSKPRATAVSFIRNNQTYTVRASKEVILCAGAISSPQILMLSGVGPEPHLKEFGIKTVKNLSVGYNLQDHFGAVLDFKVDQPLVELPFEVHSPKYLKEYLEKREGPLTGTGTQGAAFINTKYAPASGSHPDVKLSISESSIYNSGSKDIGYTQHNIKPGLFNGSRYETLKNSRLIGIYAIIMRSKSKGRIKLRSSDPSIHPIIEPNFFAEKEDMDILVEGLQEALKLASTPPFKEVGVVPLDIHFPGCEAYKLYSNDYLECYARHFTVHFHHPVGTCSMGVDKDAVVDPRLKVYGIDGLRVIDASVMPCIITGHINAPAVMIGEKGADLIKEDWLDMSGRTNEPFIK